MACSVNRETIKNGILEAVRNRLTQSKMFSEKDGVYTPDLTTDYQSVIDNINSQFKEEIIMKFYNGDDYVVVDPSPRLLNQYEMSFQEDGKIFERDVAIEKTDASLLRPPDSEGEPFQFLVKQSNEVVGDVHVMNDGTYLSVYDTVVEGKKNAGTYTYLKIAQYASENNLTFRSDKLEMMSDAAKALWERFVRNGQAQLIEDRYEFLGTGTEHIYLSASTAEGQELTSDQQKVFDNLQNIGLISQDSVIRAGKEYFKIPGNNQNTKGRLEQILHSKNIDWINIIDSPDGNLVELVEKEELNHPSSSADSPTMSSKASGITKQRVLRFLENIGFRNIQYVNKLTYKGQPLQGNAYVDLINGVMQIVEGKENYTLPEESMHILVALIEESRPELFNEMMREIVNYKMYGEVLADPAYTSAYSVFGQLDYDKIKKEAIAKLLAEYLINNLENTDESAARIEKVDNLWQKILQWIKELFSQYTNPFKKALDEIEISDTTFGEFVDVSSDDIFLSAKSVEDIDKDTPDNKAIFDNIKSRPTELGIYKVGDQYYKDGAPVANVNRVSDLVQAHYDKIFRSRNLDPDLEPFYEQSRQDGTYIHAILEEIVNNWIDPVTGLMKRNPSRSTEIDPTNPIKGKMRIDLEKYAKEFLASYPTGTRFITEQIIYDAKSNRYGTIDLVAILPSGKTDILDWKSMLMPDIAGAKDYKKDGIFIQLNEYKRILKDEYGVEEFGKLRAIPVQKNYKTFKSGARILTSIEIGDANPAKIDIEERRLRPIISPEESTGSETKDEIVTKLENLYKKYIEKGYFQKDRNILTDVQEAVYEIRVSDSVDNLANYFTDLRIKFRQLVNEAPGLMKADKQDISEALAQISFYEDIVSNVVDPSASLQEDPAINKDSRIKLYHASSDLNRLVKKLQEMRGNLLDVQAQKEGIFGLLKPEKVVNLARRIFRSMGSQDMATVRYMYELTKKAYNRIDMAVDNRLKELKNLKSGFDTWKKATNTDNKKAIGMLVNYETGRLHSKIDKSFFEERAKVQDSKKATDILVFIKKNYDQTEYNEWYAKALAENQKIWAAATYDVDSKKNARIKKSRLQEFEKNYDINKNPVTAYGYHNTKIWGKNIKEENWLSEEYKELSKPENAPLLEMYNFMVARNKELAATGSIKDYEAYTFLPNVRKDMATIFMEEDKSLLEKTGNVTNNYLRNWRASLSVEDYQLNYQGQRDPFTGEKLQKRFVPYVQHLDSNNKSFDIFTIYGLMSKEIYKEQYLSESDEIIRSLVHVEHMKPTLQQNRNGAFELDSQGRPKASQEKGKNAPVIEEHARAIVNGESLQYDADYIVSFRIREKWNNSPLGKLYKFDVNPETYNPTNISVTKFLLWLNTANQKRVLGINAASAISNLFGGTFTSRKIYHRYTSKEDLDASWFKLTSGAFYQSEEMKKNAALVDYFLPLLQNREAFKAGQLSVNDAASFLSQDWLMSPMRKTSEIVQLNVFLSIIDNTGLVDGKMVNLRQLLSKELDYENRYNLTEQGRIQLEKEFNTKLKTYKQKYGLAKTATYKTIKEGGKDKVILEIPGYDRGSTEVESLREITQTMSKDALGEADEFDKPNYKYSIWWRLFMTFKNWIPRQADVRFGEFRYDQSHHSYEYGRFRMFTKAWAANYVQTVSKLVPIPYLTGKVTDKIFTKEALIQKAKEDYESKVQEAIKLGKYNKDTFISQGEFVDRFIQGTEATFAELRTLMFMGALLFFGIAAPDDDDDASDKAYKVLIRKQLNKLIDEVGFFYSPKSGIDIAGGGAPVFSMVRDMWYLGTNVTEQFFGFGFEQLGWDEKGIKMQESAKPIKRTFKVFPVLKEILTYLPAIDNETAKEWGVKISDQRAF